MRQIVMTSLAAVLAVGAADIAAAQGRIGAVAAVNRDMAGTPPQQQRRDLILGDDVVANELIETSPIGNGHLLFVDQTSLAIAPDSNIILDRYVFDPERQAGDVAISLTKGALRFIGGKITKGRAATIRTPTATIGIRGSGAIIEVADACSGGAGASGCETKVTVLSAEEVTVVRYGDSDGDGVDDGPGDGEPASGGTLFGPGTGILSSVTLSRPGAVATSSVSEGTSFAGLASSEDLAGVIAAFEGNRDGGAPAIATTPAATVQQQSQVVAAVNSQGGGGASAAPAQSGGAADVSESVAEDTGAGAENDLGTTNLEENNLSDAFQSDPDAFFPQDIPSPADLAELTGFATYSGVAEGFLSDTTIPGGDLDPDAITGTFTMGYDFDFDEGFIDVDILNSTFSTGLTGEIPNDPTFSGSDSILGVGGPDTFSASGNFVFDGSDAAGAVTGEFEIDLVTQDQLATGTFGGPRDD
ncbi:MAG: FecR domain-containing protein [Pseudomonadota bacterium]